MKIKLISILVLFSSTFLFAFPLTTGLFGYWDMEGNFQDSSGNNHHGVAVGNNVTTSSSNSKNGKSAVFTGGSHINLGSIWPGGNTSLTMSAWVKTNTIANGTGGNLGFGNCSYRGYLPSWTFFYAQCWWSYE